MQLLVNTFPFLMVKDIVQIEVHDLYYEQKRTVISALFGFYFKLKISNQHLQQMSLHLHSSHWSGSLLSRSQNTLA